MAMIELKTASEDPRDCPNGILNEYLEYTSETECHEDFHYWMGLNLIAAAMGRRFYLDMGFGNIYPNLFTILVGEAGFSGKSTAIGMAGRCFKDGFPANDPPLLGQKLTPSALVGELGRLMKENSDEMAEGILIADEISTLLGDTRRDDEILKVLTKLWDCPDDFELTTRMRGRERIEKVCINIWAGSTPSWLKAGIPESSLEGGFFSRLILVSRPRGGKRIALPFLHMSDSHNEAYLNVAHDLKRICTMPSKGFKFEDDAARLYTQWYEEQLDKEVETANVYMRGYFARKRTTVLKLAMIISMSREDTCIMCKGDIHQALSLLEENEFHMQGLVDYLGSSQEGMDLDYVRQTLLKLWKGTRPVKITKAGNPIYRISHSILLRKISHRYGLQQVEQMIRLLEEADFLETITGRGRIYQTTDNTFTSDSHMSQIQPKDQKKSNNRSYR